MVGKAPRRQWRRVQLLFSHGTTRYFNNRSRLKMDDRDNLEFEEEVESPFSCAGAYKMGTPIARENSVAQASRYT